MAVHHPLGTLLLQEHMLKEDDLARVEGACIEQNCSFEEAVARLGLLTEETVRVFKEHLPSLALSQLVETDPVLLDLIPPPVAWRHGCIPVANLGGTLTVAVADPADEGLLRALSEDLGRPVDAVPALESDLERAIAYHYGEGEPRGETAASRAAEPGEADSEMEVNSALAGLTGAAAAPAAAEKDPEAPHHSRAEVLVEDMDAPPPQVLFANRLLSQLVLEEADRVEIRWKGEAQAEAAAFRADQREVLSAITPARAGQVIQRYRVMANMLLQSRKRPQNGTFTAKIRFEDGIVEDYKFRLNVVPIGDQEGEVATLGLAAEISNSIASKVVPGEEMPVRCPSCGAQEVYSRFRYCPLCGVGVG